MTSVEEVDILKTPGWHIYTDQGRESGPIQDGCFTDFIKSFKDKGVKILRIYLSDGNVIHKFNSSSNLYFLGHKCVADVLSNKTTNLIGVGRQEEDFIKVHWFTLDLRVAEVEKRTIESCGFFLLRNDNEKV